MVPKPLEIMQNEKLHRAMTLSPRGLTKLEKKNTQFLVGTIRQMIELADSMIIALSHIQLLAGTEELFLNKPKKQISYIQGNTRNMYLWQVCNQYDVTMTIERVWRPSLQ